MLATSLQNMAVAMTHASRVNAAIAALEEAIGIYEAMVDMGFDDDNAQGMAEAFYSLSDLYLQNGNFEMAKDRYRRSSKFQDAPLSLGHVSLLAFFYTGFVQWTALKTSNCHRC
jgi:tetratricopeptide (TPR) repeat protein